MKDFTEKHFKELLLTSLIAFFGASMLACIHWHANDSVLWLQGMINAVVVGLTATLNTPNAPRVPTAPNTTVTSTESVEVTDPNAK